PAQAVKLLFVNHSLKLGGSTRSLRELLKNLDGVEADMVVPADERTMDDAQIRAYFGPNLRRIFRFWLPFELCYRGRGSLIRHGYRWAGLAAVWLVQRRAFYRFVRAERYDAIHLNSVVLHPMVRADLPFVIHVREIVDLDLRRVRANLARAHGVIFIDEATRAPFRDLPLRRSTVINNPFDMTGVGAPPPDAAARIAGDPAQLVIFSIVGVLIPEKGVDRVIRAFRETTAQHARLVIVGQGAQEAELRRLAAGDARVVFWGVEHEIERIFALTDHVLRGEAYPCVGRTIYEALYAGCGVIIPGSESDHTLFEYERFAARVAFYPPGDEGRLRDVLEQLATRKLTVKRGESNAAAHVAAFQAFVAGAI
ncbi:MAG TPA: glycosyltransferase, partial [Kofleriaceae bacterium]|nr:glycosyltransferase [Kofleriaceae bacterium]